jgi:hypothetical protein
MRTIRALATAAALAALVPGLLAAQGGRSFKDAWFWGVKAGGFNYAKASGADALAPVAGLDWLITRSRGGLYVSYSQAFFTDTRKVITGIDASDTIPHTVNLQNLRRLELAAMAFPGSSVRWHPYVGIGFVLNQVATATPGGNYATSNQLLATQQFITSARTGFSPLVVYGTQYRLPLASLFVQGTFSPTQKNSLLYNSKAFNFAYELGLRYNVGTSIDQP